MLKVERGLTTLEEVGRVVPPDDDESDAQLARLAIAPRVADPPPEAPSTVLVVDDDQLTRRLIRLALEGARLRVIEAQDGEQALAAVYRERPDLVLTDRAMPGLDGFELLRKLRADLSTCQIPVMLLTASGDTSSEVEALELGADDYIAKPLDRDRLVGRVRRALLRSGGIRPLP
jgi:DNA-binding response OmpR family regulator